MIDANPSLASYFQSYYDYAVQNIEASASSMASVFTFGGTSILIIVGVVLETFRELEAQLTMRNYKGFL